MPLNVGLSVPFLNWGFYRAMDRSLYQPKIPNVVQNLLRLGHVSSVGFQPGSCFVRFKLLGIVVIEAGNDEEFTPHFPSYSES